jgi:hypothetical protein
MAHEPTIYVLYEIAETEIVLQKARITDAKMSAGRA